MPDPQIPHMLLKPEAVAAIHRLLERLDYSDVDAAPTVRLMQEFLEVADAAQYVDYGFVRDKMMKFLDRPDVVDELENEDG